MFVYNGGMEALDELKQNFYLKYRENRHIHALSQQDRANGNTVSKGGWGKGVYRESDFYFQTLHSSNINSKAGSTDPKFYFCIYFGAAFSFNVDGKTEQAVLPLSAAQQSPGQSQHSLGGGGIGKRGEGGGNG